MLRGDPLSVVESLLSFKINLNLSSQGVPDAKTQTLLVKTTKLRCPHLFLSHPQTLVTIMPFHYHLAFF